MVVRLSLDITCGVEVYGLINGQQNVNTNQYRDKLTFPSKIKCPQFYFGISKIEFELF